MRVLLIPVGSAGDVHPHVGLGVALRERGHDVSVVTNAYFTSTVSAAGLRHVPWGTVDQYEAVTKHPHLWHQRKGIEVIARMLRVGMPALYDILVDESRRGDVLLVGHGLAFAARLAHEELGLPLVTVHLQPSSLYSVYDSPVLHPWLGSINELPLEVKRFLFRVIDRAADRVFAPVVNDLRRAHDLAPVRHVTSQWWHSPQQVIGLFPRWLAPPQPDWPAHTEVTGFPLFDADSGTGLESEVERFLDSGTPPIVFVPGSGNRQARRFFQAAVEACQRLGRRGLFLTRYADHLPAALPDGVRRFDYVPLGRVLPRASALVHHGGIGTAAQGLANALPQLIMPMTFDQPDNAHRLEQLGVARTVWPRAFRGPEVVDALDDLLPSGQVRAACTMLSQKIRSDRPLTRTCELIERQMAAHRRFMP